MSLFWSCVCALLAHSLGLRTGLTSREGRAERRDCPDTPVKGKEVCFFLTGETFREGGQWSRRTGETELGFREQELASRSQVTELFEVFENELCAKPVVFLTTTHSFNVTQRSEAALNTLAGYYGRWLPREHIKAGWKKDQFGMTKRPALDPLRAFSWGYSRSQACDGGLMWTRPDLVFSRNMSAVLRTAGRDPKDYERGGAAGDFPWPRYSFVEGRVKPVDLSKMMFLYPVWREWEKNTRRELEKTRRVLAANSSTDHAEYIEDTRWRLADTWLWIPGKLWRNHSLAWRKLKLSHDVLFDLPVLGLSESQVRAWVEEHVAFLGINSQHDTNSLNDWNPFYRMAGRPRAEFRPGTNTPSRETEEHMRSVFSRIVPSLFAAGGDPSLLVAGEDEAGEVES